MYERRQQEQVDNIHGRRKGAIKAGNFSDDHDDDDPSFVHFPDSIACRHALRPRGHGIFSSRSEREGTDCNVRP